ncbi:hypothetical protein G6M26_25785 [Agrobacterium tumefaciens]|nr:hypothetical protein [Agrobacterium tumefaciens]NTE21961.1 hypothetical protein [Agrobacterium tumefaciens]
MSLLVITSAVFVNSGLTVLTDPELRKSQYIESIKFYLKSETITTIIVCDNSGFDFSTIKSINLLAAKNNKTLEILYFTGNYDKILKHGKGFGEGEILNYIMNNSLIIEYFESFFKVTGRINILNIDTIVRNTNTNLNYFQKVGINPFNQNRKYDTRFYHCGLKIFKAELVDAYYNVDDFKGYYLEHAYFDRISSAKIKRKNFLNIPNYSGFSGSTGLSYKIPGIKFLLKKIVYSCLYSFYNR